MDLLEVRGPSAAANPELELPTIACQGERGGLTTFALPMFWGLRIAQSWRRRMRP